MAQKRPSLTPGGDLELALLSALWASPGSGATARELFSRVSPTRGIVYTTVAKVLDRLAEKRMVARRRKGRARVYTARVGPEATHRAIARRMIEQLREAGPRPAAAALLGALEDISPEWIEALRAEIRERRRTERGA